MRRRRRFLFALVALGIAGAWSSAGTAAPRSSAPRRPVLVHLRFQAIPSASSVVTDGRYVFLNNPTEPYGGNHPDPPPVENFTGGVLVDERTGTHARITRQGCYAITVGYPWLLFSCPYASPPSSELYSITHRHWRPVKAPPFDNPVAVGADWIEYFAVDSGGYVFQNIASGRLRILVAWRPGGRIIPDLNAPSLARTLCAPLRVPADWTPYAAWSAYPFNEKLHAGAVTLDGRFAIAAGTTHPDLQGQYASETLLERCGSYIRRPLGGDFTASPHVVLAGNVYNGPLAGYALPSLTPVRVAVPQYDQGLYRPYSFVLSARGLYLVDWADNAFFAPVPRLILGR